LAHTHTHYINKHTHAHTHNTSQKTPGQVQHHLAQDAREAACLGIGNEDEVVQIRATRVVVVWTVPVIPLK
jgi:hypothetical protein